MVASSLIQGILYSAQLCCFFIKSISRGTASAVGAARAASHFCKPGTYLNGPADGSLLGVNENTPPHGCRPWCISKHLRCSKLSDADLKTCHRCCPVIVLQFTRLLKKSISKEKGQPLAMKTAVTIASLHKPVLFYPKFELYPCTASKAHKAHSTCWNIDEIGAAGAVTQHFRHM